MYNADELFNSYPFKQLLNPAEEFSYHYILIQEVQSSNGGNSFLLPTILLPFRKAGLSLEAAQLNYQSLPGKHTGEVELSRRERSDAGDLCF